ncbi:cysteine-rich CWC family protein [Amphritea atlantica]|uniref:Cysteine-rich CWC family protein n=1 Tax=Amphritea atlantica TaxID=355243 RepID=A0ABY5GQD4_9GAMM|nr:cysteine-rich CWC family protein [Amphritea atlantica]
MSTTPDTIDPNVCPLCQQANRCGNIASCGSDPHCWCSSPEITFSDALLNQVPEATRGKACICRSCALANS